MKCAAFASWLLLLPSVQAQKPRSLLRSGSFEKEQAKNLQSEWDFAVSNEAINDVNHDVVLAGIIHHGAEISTNSLNFLVEVTCINKIRTHVLGADDMEILAGMYNRLKDKRFPGQLCAPLMVAAQPIITQEQNRITRIVTAREYQKNSIAEQYVFSNLDKATIILADLDVNELPPRDQVVNNAMKMNSRAGMDVDVLCSAGKMLNPNGYYDTFATILLPDTFVYPIGGRPDLKARPEEDPSLIIGENFNAEQLMEWFQIKGGANADPVPVKSCFGGLAIYRASKWLDQRCSYKDLQPEVNAKYANRYDKAPCEHVVLHNCLQAIDPSVVIAVQPDMHTLWHTTAGPQYALGSYPEVAANFILDHLFSVHSARHLLGSNATGNFTNSSLVDSTMANSTFINNTFFNFTVIPQWVIDAIFNSSIFDLNCTIVNTTNLSGFSNFTVTNCTKNSSDRRMVAINDLVRVLYSGQFNSNNTSTNITSGNTTIGNSTNGNLTIAGFPNINDFIHWVYDSLPDFGSILNSTNSTNSTILPTNSTNSTRKLELNVAPERILLTEPVAPERILVTEPAKVKVDFAIVGFPKCGTTSLLFAFKNNQETSIGNVEECRFADSSISNGQAYTALETAVSGLSQDPSVKRGIKCPIGLDNVHSIDRLDAHSPQVKLLIGIRHPVKFFQSYYNYRVTEIYDHKRSADSIPPLESLVGKKQWNGVSTESARFELFLMQLGKTDMSINDFESMYERPHLAVKPNKFKIFLYTLSQMEDTTKERKESFREQLRQFLGLQNPLPEVPQENRNPFVGKKAHNETIDICDSKYDAVRAMLVEQGEKTQKWIREEFMMSPDVVVGNRDHFLAMLDTWSHDPCREYIAAKVDGAPTVWFYIQGFITPFFDMIGSFFS